MPARCGHAEPRPSDAEARHRRQFALGVGSPVIQPDIVFFRRERRHLLEMMQATRIPPDLAVEVLSRSTEMRDRGRKMELLARFGVPEYWIVDPVENRLEIYALNQDAFTLAAVHLEGEQVHSPTLSKLLFDSTRVFEE